MPNTYVEKGGCQSGRLRDKNVHACDPSSMQRPEGGQSEESPCAIADHPPVSMIQVTKCNKITPSIEGVVITRFGATGQSDVMHEAAERWLRKIPELRNSLPRCFSASPSCSLAA
eukprot:6170537-Amphidinium_carterae.1